MKKSSIILPIANQYPKKITNKFINLVICFLVIMFSISIPKTSYSMSFFASELEKKYKPLSLPTSVPFDITKKGNEVETYIKVEEEHGYSFELEFRYYDPSRDKHSKYYRSPLKRFFSQIGRFEKYFKKYTKEEWEEINTDFRRVLNFVDHGKLENGKFVKYTGIATPIHIIVTKINEDGSEEVMTDLISETKNITSGGIAFHNVIIGYERSTKLTYKGKAKLTNILLPGMYRVKAIAEKDSPELVGTDIQLYIARTFYGK